MADAADFKSKQGALDALVRAMRVPAEQADSRALIDTAAMAVEHCLVELGVSGSPALARIFAFDELAQPHLRRLTNDYLAARSSPDVTSGHWAIGIAFLTTLSAAYRSALDAGNAPNIARGDHLELMVRQLRCMGNLLKWRAMAYFAADSALWSEVAVIYRRARNDGLAGRQVALRRDRSAQTSIEREMARLIALASAGLDQMPPNAVEVIDRIVRYALPAFQLLAKPAEGVRFSFALGDGLPPRRVDVATETGGDVLYLWCEEAVVVLDELASVVARGLAPAALTDRTVPRETVLGGAYHLRRLWSGPRRTRRCRRHPLTGKLRALMGIKRLQSQLGEKVEEAVDVWQWNMLDVSRNGMGILVPAADCSQISVGDILGVQAEDGESWHVGIVRRIVRVESGEGIVGIETVAKSVTTASVDNGQALSDVLLCDPIRRGGSVRIAHSPEEAAAGDLVFLSQSGRVCKLRRLSTLVRGSGYELSSYHVL
ncbi:MAG: hypothetical protein KDG55_19435 [Rhodocyclaceae bacterium]|nr:hypothetical protein [Rhodocyclaceae bacterium]